MNRRHFLTASAAATAAAACTGPLILGAEDKGGSKLPRVGTGEHTYECHHNWGQLPGDLEWQTTHNVAVDAQGQVYVTHQGMGKKHPDIDTTFVFDPAGKFVRSFGKEWWGGGHGIDIRKDGGEEFLYLTNTWKSPKVVKATLKGETVWKMERPEAREYEGDPKEKTYNPTNVAFCPDGGFFVGDGYGSHYMMKYGPDGKLLKVFGGKGTTDGKFQTPHGNWVDTRDPARPVLVVCDRANFRLQAFDLDGKFLEVRRDVLFPAHIDTHKDVMMVADLHARVSLFDKNDTLITHLGDDAAWRKKVLTTGVRNRPKDWLPGKFVHPHDACFDKDGNIYVAEWVTTGRITFLEKVG